ncbi:MAG: cache domain-containing protein, partial [Myxococcota bacterium]|nr:cache domain-containing protein [Myxococcota bacterium]
IERIEGQDVRDRRVQVSLDGARSYGETDKTSDYDPRMRPWYEMVVEKGHGMWTDTYVFYTAGEPGLTAAQPVFGPDGSLVAVSATDITMGALSGFLAEQKIGKTGTALILNPRDEVVAHPDPAVFVGSDGEIELPSLDGLGVSWWSDALSHHKRTGDANLRYKSGELRYMAHFIEFPESFRKRWRLAVVVPVDDFMDRSRQIRTKSLLISALTLLVAILLSSVLSRRVSRPIMGLAEKVQHIREFRLDNDFGARSRIREVQVMSDALGTMQAGLRSFSRFVPADLVRQLVEAGEEAQLGGQERNITVLFSDLRGYSTIIEYMPPQDVLGMLNEYLGGMQEVIEQHQGTVLEYIGDAILVVFGAPSNLEGHPEMAVRCALAMQQRLVGLNDHWIGTGIAKT